MSALSSESWGYVQLFNWFAWMTNFDPLFYFVLQKTATAVAHCKRGHGLIRVNGRPLDNIEPKILQYKLQEPILLLGKVSYFFSQPFGYGVYKFKVMINFLIPKLKDNEINIFKN